MTSITKLTVSENNTYNSFIGAHPIDRITTYRVRVVRLIDSCLWFGVGTKAVFSFVNFNSKNFLSFNFHTRELYVNGEASEVGW